MTGSTLPARQLGEGLAVSAVSFGAMGMSEFYGPTDDTTSLAVLDAALDLGVTMFDTADTYGQGHNEDLLARFIASHPAGRNAGTLRIATKFGIHRPSGGYSRSLNNSPAYIRAACDASLKRLKIDTIDLYYVHRIDPAADLATTMETLSALVQEGKIRHVGLCEASAATITKAHAIHPVTAVQSEYSLWSRDVEETVLPACRRLGVGFVAYSPLGRGFLTGRITSTDGLDDTDFRRANPRFQDQNMARNRDLLATVEAVADRNGCSLGQVALAWVLAQGKEIVVIPGTRHQAYLEENVGAARITLAANDLDALSAVFQPAAIAGERYTAEGMKGVNA